MGEYASDMSLDQREYEFWKRVAGSKVLRIPTVPESVARTVRRHMKDAELWEKKDRCGCPVCVRFRLRLKKAKELARD